MILSKKINQAIETDEIPDLKNVVLVPLNELMYFRKQAEQYERQLKLIGINPEMLYVGGND